MWHTGHTLRFKSGCSGGFVCVMPLSVMSAPTSSGCHHKYYRTGGQLTYSTTPSWTCLLKVPRIGVSRNSAVQSAAPVSIAYAPSCAAVMRACCLLGCASLCDTVNREGIKPVAPRPFKISIESSFIFYFISYVTWVNKCYYGCRKGSWWPPNRSFSERYYTQPIFLQTHWYIVEKGIRDFDDSHCIPWLPLHCM